MIVELLVCHRAVRGNQVACVGLSARPGWPQQWLGPSEEIATHDTDLLSTLPLEYM